MVKTAKPLDLDAIQARCDAATPIAWAPGYRIATDGRVYSSIEWSRHKGTRELTQHPNSDGYMRVRLVVAGRRKHVFVHKLVAQAFLPNRPSPTHEIRHLDGDKNNNAAGNLLWGTAKENAEDRERHGHTARGERNGARRHPERVARGSSNGASKLTEDAIRQIRQRLANGETSLAIAPDFGISHSTVRLIRAGKRWAHVI